MAGIGFQLKAMMREKSLSNKIKGYAYSALVSAGPWLAAVVTVNILLFLSRIYLNSLQAQSLFLGTIVYTFVFSQIITSPWQMIITRAYSDYLFQKNHEAVLPAFVGSNLIVFITAITVTVIFYYGKPLPLSYKVMAGYLFVVLTLIWMVMVSLSSIKDYEIIAKAYIIGGVISICLTIFFMERPIMFESYIMQSNILLAYMIGITITYIILLYSFLKLFHFGNPYIFDFLEYVSLYPSLFFTGLFYTLGLWVDDIIMWLSEIGVSVISTYYYAPVYDNAVFLAYLTIVPTSVMFLIVIETSLYDDYKAYYGNINGVGNLREIEASKKSLQKTVKQGLVHTFQVQGLITLTLILFSEPIFKFMNLSIVVRDIFRVAAFGALFNIFILNIILIMLYFEARDKAFKSAFMFFLTNLVFTIYVSQFGIRYYGYGFTLSAFVSLIYSLWQIKALFKELTRDTFLSQPIYQRKRVGVFLLFARLYRVYTFRKNHPTQYNESK